MTLKFQIASILIISNFILSCSTNSSNNSEPEAINTQECVFDENKRILDCIEQKYRTTKVGSQVWLAQNLNFDPKNDDGVCYNDSTINCIKYGRLYSWNTAKLVCPKGWHLPSDDEWKQLEKSAGMPLNEVDEESGRGETSWGEGVGIRLMADSTEWERQRGSDQYSESSDVYGFTALGGGVYSTHTLEYKDLNRIGYWWTSSAYNSNNAWMRSMDRTRGFVNRINNLKSLRESVRCIQN